MIGKLKKHPLVKYLEWNYYKIVVKFTTGITERWILRDHFKGNPSCFVHRFPMDDPSAYSDEEIPIYSEFETLPFDDEEKEFLKPFFIIQNKDLKRAGWINVRLTVHKVIDMLIEEGWVDLRYPESILEKDLEMLQKINADRCVAPGKVMMCDTSHRRCAAPGLALVQHFLKWGDIDEKSIKEGWTKPGTLYMAIQSIISSRLDLTRFNIVRHLRNPLFGAGRRVCGPRFTDPSFYYSVIKNFFRKYTTIYDHDPRLGSKMMAATLLDAEYIPNNLEEGLYKLAERIKCRIGTERQEYDLVILTSLEPLKADDAISLIDEYLPRCKGLAVIVDRDDLEYITNTFSPTRILEAHMYPLFLQDMGLHYLLIYQR